MSRRKVIIIFVILLVILAVIFILNSAKNEEIIHDFTNFDASSYDKLMIVAHPDDEMLWGGSHLIDENYLVVCITCGGDEARVKEIKKVLKETNDGLIMLGYPDKTNGERDNWNSSKDGIIKDLKNIIALKDWDSIVTHNPFGEYGHIHHKMTSELVTNNYDNKDKLVYFGVYYSKKKIGSVIEKMPTISNKNLDKKIEILKLYKTQSFIMTAFDHMFEHEDFITYNDWQMIYSE